ncbi:MAG: hypothetical protein E6I95_12955 [Chloroflexi bacterium]|jgi:glutamine synthetase|nr:MAG: hypothetical protein E6I95_12955 [Chloroflexota bacterium]
MTDVHARKESAAVPNGELAGARLTVEALERAVAERTVDTVVLALVDMEGRLVGKRLTGRHFLESTVPHGAEYEGDHPHVPHSMRAARDLFAASEVARAAFGGDVVDHYVHRADLELAAFESSVTDWERIRGFERL